MIKTKYFSQIIDIKIVKLYFSYYLCNYTWNFACLPFSKIICKISHKQEIWFLHFCFNIFCNVYEICVWFSLRECLSFFSRDIHMASYYFCSKIWEESGLTIHIWKEIKLF